MNNLNCHFRLTDVMSRKRPFFAGAESTCPETLLDYLKGGESIDDFLEGFPTVTCAQGNRLSRRSKTARAADANRGGRC